MSVRRESQSHGQGAESLTNTCLCCCFCFAVLSGLFRESDLTLGNLPAGWPAGHFPAHLGLNPSAIFFIQSLQELSRCQGGISLGRGT